MANGARIVRKSAAGERWFYLAFATGIAFSASSLAMLAGVLRAAPWPNSIGVLLGAAVINGVIAFAISDLARRYPGAVPVRAYIGAAFGPTVALWTVYLYLMLMLMVAAVEHALFANAIAPLTGAIHPLIVTIAVLGFVCLCNTSGYLASRRLQVATTIALLAVVVTAGIAGAWIGDATVARPQASIDAGALLTAFGRCVYLFVGFEWVTVVAARPSSYQRDIPTAMMGAIGLNLAAYLVLSWGVASMGAAYMSAWDATMYVTYLEQLLGSTFGTIVAGSLSLLAITSTINAGLLGASRLVNALSREGSLPRWLGAVSADGVPARAVLVLSTLVAAFTTVVIRYGIVLEVASAAAAIVSIVYSGFVLAHLSLGRRRSRPGGVFRSMQAVEVIVAMLMPVIGIMAVVGDAETRVVAAGFLLAACVLSIVLTLLSRRARDSWSRQTVRRMTA